MPASMTWQLGGRVEIHTTCGRSDQNQLGEMMLVAGLT